MKEEKTIPENGTYNGEIDGTDLVLNDKHYALSWGIKAHYGGQFRIEDGDVYILPGAVWHFGGFVHDIRIDDLTNGDIVGSFKDIQYLDPICYPEVNEHEYGEQE